MSSEENEKSMIDLLKEISGKLDSSNEATAEAKAKADEKAEKKAAEIKKANEDELKALRKRQRRI
jgi:dsDNA-specific endonuclease/ATPase MutS2